MNPLFQLLGRYVGNRMANDQSVLPDMSSLPSLPSLSSPEAPEAPQAPQPTPMMSMPQPTPSVPASSMSLTDPNPAPTPTAPKPFNYGDTFLRTPANANDAKAAEEIRNLLYPQPAGPKMSEMQPQQTKTVDELVAKQAANPTPAKTPTAKPVSKPTSDEDALKETEAEVGNDGSNSKESTLDRLMKEYNKPDTELNDALAKRQKDMALAGIMKGIARAGTALSTRGDKTLDQVSPGAFSDFEKQAMLPVEDIKTKRQARDEDIKRRQNILSAANSELTMQTEEQKRDSTSDVSKMYRDVIGQAMPELKIPNNISATELEKLVGPLQNAANMKLTMESKKEIAAMNADARKAAQDERKLRADQRQEDVTFKEQERYQNSLSKLDAKNNEATKYMDEAQALADQATRNPQSAMNLARSVIKAVEGAGARVSDKDFATAVGDQSLGGTMMNTLNRLKSGTIREVTKEQVIQMLNASKEIQRQKYNQMVKTEVERYAKRAKTSPEDAADLGMVNKEVLKAGKKIVKKEYSASRDQTRLTYDDGSQEFVNGKQQ